MNCGISVWMPQLGFLPWNCFPANQGHSAGSALRSPQGRKASWISMKQHRKSWWRRSSHLMQTVPRSVKDFHRTSSHSAILASPSTPESLMDVDGRSRLFPRVQTIDSPGEFACAGRYSSTSIQVVVRRLVWISSVTKWKRISRNRSGDHGIRSSILIVLDLVACWRNSSVLLS